MTTCAPTTVSTVIWASADAVSVAVSSPSSPAGQTMRRVVPGTSQSAAQPSQEQAPETVRASAVSVNAGRRGVFAWIHATWSSVKEKL